MKRAVIFHLDFRTMQKGIGFARRALKLPEIRGKQS
jgi:hypothetical protein